MADTKETLVVISKVKAFIKDQGCMVSGDTAEALNRKVCELLTNAVARTKENKRSTLRPHDL